jgi:hypothetical protein
VSEKDLSVRGSDPMIDENGVDRAQIRRMLGLTPRERLKALQEFMDAAERIWKLNGIRPVR